jgi:hypothetical protein
VLLVQLPRLTFAPAMWWAENLPQPVRLVESGQANEQEARLQLEAWRGVQCRRIVAASSRWPELVFQLCIGIAFAIGLPVSCS